MSFVMSMTEWGGYVSGLKTALTVLRELPIEQAIAKIEETAKVGFEEFAYGPCNESEDFEDDESSDDSDDSEQPHSPKPE